MQKIIKPISSGTTTSGKKKDCVIRALSNVTGIDYVGIEEYFNSLGRKENHATELGAIIESFAVFKPTEIILFGTTLMSTAMQRIFDKRWISYTVQKGHCLKKFIQNYPKGKYFVMYRGHALAVIDGAIVDTYASRANKYVCAAIKFD